MPLLPLFALLLAQPALIEQMHKAAKEVQNASTFVFNYDLATPPEMSEPGLNVIQKFVDDPSKLDGDLREAQSAADGVFKKN